MNFSDFDFKLLDTQDFKEDSVREELILPILKNLGYKIEQIIRSKSLQHPFLKIGSKKRPVNLVPDYLLKVEENYAWVLDAKAPNELITTGEHIEQIYSYAIHPEIRTKFFALCNGREFVVFRLDSSTPETPELYFELRDIERYWGKLENLLGSNAFQTGKTFQYTPKAASTQKFDYLDRPLLEEIEVKKQTAKRHFGVHGYFTKQSWNVVQEYIRNFTQVGDVVLDPFGGSGVTAVEALMCDRKGINIDLNPMPVFIVESLITPVNLGELTEAFERIQTAYTKNEPKSEDEIANALTKYTYPRGFKLPKGSDVEVVEDLFSKKQLAQLGYLKHLIKKEKGSVQKTLMLAFSSTLTKTNRTYHNSSSRGDNAGDSAAFRYYRYRIAADAVELDLFNSFSTKYKKIVSAKKEIAPKINASTIHNAQIVKGSATHLDFIKNESVDYIYTDPPYGKKIPYLDLSVMWNAWLDLPVTEEDYENEAIEGGEHGKSKSEYNDLMSKSIQEMYRVLKFDRWMSFVFAHKDPEFWHLIIDTAEKCGFEYAGAVAQKNGQTSFKKRQNPFTVLSGQLIINFKKVRKPKAIMKASLGMDISEVVMQTIEGIIAKNHGATLEQINDELIIKGLELGFLDLLKKQYTDLTPLLLESFDYDEKTELYSIKKETKFRTHVDLRLRVRYYLISYLRRMTMLKKSVTFDDIVLYVLPLLKNGITPENQTISNVLVDIAVRTGEDHWEIREEKVNNDKQKSLF